MVLCHFIMLFLKLSPLKSPCYTAFFFLSLQKVSMSLTTLLSLTLLLLEPTFSLPHRHWSASFEFWLFIFWLCSFLSQLWAHFLRLKRPFVNQNPSIEHYVLGFIRQWSRVLSSSRLFFSSLLLELGKLISISGSL